MTHLDELVQTLLKAVSQRGVPIQLVRHDGTDGCGQLPFELKLTRLTELAASFHCGREARRLADNRLTSGSMLPVGFVFKIKKFVLSKKPQVCYCLVLFGFALILI